MENEIGIESILRELSVGIHSGWTGPAIHLLTLPNQLPQFTIQSTAFLGNILQIGTVIGVFLGFLLSTKWSKQKPLLLTSILFSLSFYLIFEFPKLYVFYIARFTAGIATGISYSSGLLYANVMEMAPDNTYLSYAGDLARNLGVFCVYVCFPWVGFEEAHFCFLFIALGHCCICFFVPESPCVLLRKGDENGANKVWTEMKKYQKKIDDHKQFDRISTKSSKSSSKLFYKIESASSLNIIKLTSSTKIQENRRKPLKKCKNFQELQLECRKQRIPVLDHTIFSEYSQSFIYITIVILGYKCSGSHVLKLFSHSIFWRRIPTLGEETGTADTFGIIYSFIALFCQVTQTYLARTYNRKLMFIFSGLSMTISLILLGLSLYNDSIHFLRTIMILYSLSRGIGYGAMTDHYISELMPPEIIIQGTCFVFIIASCFGVFVTHIYTTLSRFYEPYVAVWTFAGLTFSNCFIIWLLLPETKDQNESVSENKNEIRSSL